MSERDKIASYDCNATIILKNLKLHYQQCHESKKVKHTSITGNSVLNFFQSGRKRKIDEIEEEQQDDILKDGDGGAGTKENEENRGAISSKKFYDCCK
ncbi:hypothetical protein AVEN_80753-1 [Araneus ventricosus]|uniref:Uncharacterized protein n=1 Tax=Araneus ventricosus TaxID=182803 RepID=A0A4Y2J2B2_ARAVE|nr:hypothetical protein AVEN_80753-1 [Araneus ventricosus]